MLVVIDGPEKTGKTTLAQALADQCRPRHAVVFRFRYPPRLLPGAYLEAVRLGARPDTWVVLDRSWAADVVYSRLVRKAAPAVPEWWYEWTLGMPALTLGVRLMALPSSRLAVPSADDHQLDYATERGAFLEYAHRWQWLVADTSRADPRDLAQEVLERAMDAYALGPRAPVWSGSRTPRLAYVGEARNAGSNEALAWAPLTTYYWRRELEERLDEVRAHWPLIAATNARDLDPYALGILSSAQRVVAYGKTAARVLRDAGIECEERVHPAARFRWRNRYPGS